MGDRNSHPHDTSGARPDFARLVEEHYAALYRFALSLTRSETDAADLVQGTFLTWATKGHQLMDAAKAKPWLYTTLHRRFLERHRQTIRFPHVDLVEAEPDLPAVDPDVLRDLDARALLLMLEKLEPEFQAPVALFYLEDYPYREIAAILDVPLGTVKSRIARGLIRLRLLMTEKAGTKSLREEEP